MRRQNEKEKNKRNQKKLKKYGKKYEKMKERMNELKGKAPALLVLLLLLLLIAVVGCIEDNKKDSSGDLLTEKAEKVATFGARNDRNISDSFDINCSGSYFYGNR